tara:strand:+ start:64 stop:444 length:381 start_codon:yes stop_codon:yes gene_type:complete
MTTLLSAFNNLVINFCDDLIFIFPEENDFKVYKRGISMLNSVNAKKICLLFKTYSTCYKNEIINKNENFFLTNDYSNIKKDYSDSTASIEIIINELKKYWGQLSNENKEKIWEYLNSMIKLSSMIA